VLQQQLRAAGIELNIRSAEFGTFYADVTHGAFQMYILKWIGSNEDPDIYRYMDSSGSFPPKGANRGHYVNAQVDALLAKAAAESGPEAEVEARFQIMRWCIRGGCRGWCRGATGTSIFCVRRGCGTLKPKG
jgi:ABC-type transport system substrate-binding protein